MEEGSSEDRWPSRRRHRLADLNADEPDEGEFVPGHNYHYHPGVDTEKYGNSNRDCSSDSEETISDTVPANYGDARPSCAAANNDNNGATSSYPVPAAAAAAAVFACPFCWKEFRSHKAVCGHMKVHRDQGIKKHRKVKRNVAAAVGSRCGATTSNPGCLGSTGRKAAEPDQSMDVVVAAESKIVLQPKPLAFAVPNPSSSVPESSSPKPMQKDAMEIVAVRAANPPAAPVKHQQLVAPPPGDRRSPKGYTCKKCGMWFRTPQELGGHMRKHWSGPPINKKPRVVIQPLPPPPPRTTNTGGVAELKLAPTVTADEALPPAPRLPVAGRVRLFGIDIVGPGVRSPAAQQGSPATCYRRGVHQ